MDVDDPQDWLIELLKSDPEDFGLRQALDALTADAGARESQLSQLSTVDLTAAVQAAGHGPLEHVPTELASRQCIEEDVLEPFSHIPSIPCLSSDDLQCLEALHSGGHLCNPDPGNEVSLQECSVPSDLCDKSRARASRGQTSTALDFGRLQEDHVVASDRLASGSFSVALPGRPSKQASSSSQMLGKQGLARGWDMHKELLLRRAVHRPALQDSSTGAAALASLNSLDHPSDSGARQRLASYSISAPQHPDTHESPLQRRQNIVQKLPGGILVCQHPQEKRLGQQPRRQQAVQSRAVLLSAQKPLKAAAFQMRHIGSAGHEAHKRGREQQFNTLHSQPAVYRLVPTASSASLGSPNPHQPSHAIPGASTAVRSKQTPQWQSLRPQQREQAALASAPSAKRVQCSHVASETAKEFQRQNGSQMTSLTVLPSARKLSQDQLSQTVANCLLRDPSERRQESLDLSMKAANSELAKLQQCKQALQKNIEALLIKQQALEAAERTVHRLTTQLDCMRLNPDQSLTFNIDDVINLVYGINLARGLDCEGYGSYISSQFAKRCLALPFDSSGTGWERKKDTSAKHSAMKMAFAFAAGDKSAGEVEMELTAKYLKGMKVKLKDLVTLSTDAIQEIFDKFALSAAEIVSEAAKVEPGLEKRKSLESAMNLMGTEGLCISHIHYVFSPLHYRSPESWEYRQRRGASLQKDAAHARAWACLESSGADMASLESMWTERAINLEPLRLRQKELKEEVAQHFQTLQAQAGSTVDFSALLETVRHFKLSLDEAAVIHSVAITASDICILNSWQKAQAVAACFPHVMNYEILHALGNVY